MAYRGEGSVMGCNAFLFAGETRYVRGLPMDWCRLQITRASVALFPKGAEAGAVTDHVDPILMRRV